MKARAWLLDLLSQLGFSVKEAECDWSHRWVELVMHHEDATAQCVSALVVKQAMLAVNTSELATLLTQDAEASVEARSEFLAYLLAAMHDTDGVFTDSLVEEFAAVVADGKLAAASRLCRQLLEAVSADLALEQVLLDALRENPEDKQVILA